VEEKRRKGWRGGDNDLLEKRENESVQWGRRMLCGVQWGRRGVGEKDALWGAVGEKGRRKLCGGGEVGQRFSRVCAVCAACRGRGRESAFFYSGAGRGVLGVQCGEGCEECRVFGVRSKLKQT